MMKLIIPTFKKLYMLFMICSFIITNGEALPKHVCVIGAGRAGLAVIKKVADQIGKFTPIAFERNSDVGGLWIYSDETGLDKHGFPIQSRVYKNLKTITIKDEMIYPDYPALKSSDQEFFLSHQTFLEYMRNYTDHFQLRKYIQFNTIVTKVIPLKDRCNRATSSWQITSRNLDTNKVDTTVCEAVIVCNGRYYKPNMPKLPGIELFSGRVIHSHAYRRPEEFKDKTVIVWGAGASALGIARDLVGHADIVFLSNRNKYNLHIDGLPDRILNVKNVVKFDGRYFILEDDSKITADAFIYCTGYVYDFPFLDANSGMTHDKQQLFPLAKNFINKEHPTMAFIGLGANDVFGVDFYAESQYFLSTLEGRKQ